MCCVIQKSNEIFGTHSSLEFNTRASMFFMTLSCFTPQSAFLHYAAELAGYLTKNQLHIPRNRRVLIKTNIYTDVISDSAHFCMSRFFLRSFSSLLAARPFSWLLFPSRLVSSPPLPSPPLSSLFFSSLPCSSESLLGRQTRASTHRALQTCHTLH